MKKKSIKKKEKSMAELTKGYEKFAKGKNIVVDGKKGFDEALKKVVKPSKKEKE